MTDKFFCVPSKDPNNENYQTCVLLNPSKLPNQTAYDTKTSCDQNCPAPDMNRCLSALKQPQQCITDSDCIDYLTGTNQSCNYVSFYFDPTCTNGQCNYKRVLT